MRHTLQVEIAGSMNSGGGSCIMIHDGHNPPIVIECGACFSDKKTAANIQRAIFNAQPEVLALSHFHFDHWGGIPSVLAKMDDAGIKLPTIVSTGMTKDFLQSHIRPMTPSFAKSFAWREGRDRKLNRISLVPNKHSVPGSAGILVQGSQTLFYTGDCYDIDLPYEFPKTDLLIIDSTGATRECPREDKEEEIRLNIIELVRETLQEVPGSRVYIALFSSRVERACYLQQRLRPITRLLPMVKGISLSNALQVFSGSKCVSGSKGSRVALVTGIWAQGGDWRFGESASALVKIANGWERGCRVREGDLVILSGSIPAWSAVITRQIKAMCVKLREQGARVVVDTTAPESWETFAERRQVHTSGHGNMPEIAGLIDRIRPKAVLPFHASWEARQRVAEYCRKRGIGVVEDQSLPIIELT